MHFGPTTDQSQMKLKSCHRSWCCHYESNILTLGSEDCSLFLPRALGNTEYNQKVSFFHPSFISMQLYEYKFHTISCIGHPVDTLIDPNVLGFFASCS